ncbi:MAG: site-specific integrase [Micropruina sp.]
MLAWISNPRWAAATRKSHRAALTSFYSWACMFGHLVVDPSRKLPPIRVPHMPARPAPESAVRRALLASGPREQLMVSLAAFHGLRRGEIARIHSRDVVEDLAGWSLRVHGKGGKQRVIPLSDDTAEQLRATPAGWVFPSPSGGHLTDQHVGKLIARVLPDGWTAHTLRHRFATIAYAGTRDLLAVQEMLGHSKPETTRGYVQLPQTAMRAAILAAA